MKADVATLQAENPGTPVPIDMVTTSGSGLDPDITPAAAEFQIPRVAKARGISEDAVREQVRPAYRAAPVRISRRASNDVLELNLALDHIPYKQASR